MCLRQCADGNSSRALTRVLKDARISDPTRIGTMTALQAAGAILSAAELPPNPDSGQSMGTPSPSCAIPPKRCVAPHPFDPRSHVGPHPLSPSPFGRGGTKNGLSFPSPAGRGDQRGEDLKRGQGMRRSFSPLRAPRRAIVWRLDEKIAGVQRPRVAGGVGGVQLSDPAACRVVT